MRYNFIYSKICLNIILQKKAFNRYTDKGFYLYK